MRRESQTNGRCAIVGGMLHRAASFLRVSFVDDDRFGASPVTSRAGACHTSIRLSLLRRQHRVPESNSGRVRRSTASTSACGSSAHRERSSARSLLVSFGNVRFGDEDAFQLVRPVVSFDDHRSNGRSFIFGTLSTPRAGRPPGPDRTGPHGLLPPLQRETLAFNRPYEAGLSWVVRTAHEIRHELWIDWQRLNTPEHRERFDAGANGEIHIARLVRVPFQLHIVHEGGQLFGGRAGRRQRRIRGRREPARKGWSRWIALGLEVFGLGSWFVPDRGVPIAPAMGRRFFVTRLRRASEVARSPDCLAWKRTTGQRRTREIPTISR